MSYSHQERPPLQERDFLLDIRIQHPQERNKVPPFRALVDTGTQGLLMSHRTARRENFIWRPSTSSNLLTVHQRPVKVLGEVRATWFHQPGRKGLEDTFLVIEDLKHDILIGRKRWHEVKSSLPRHIFDLSYVGAPEESTDKTGELAAPREWIWNEERRDNYNGRVPDRDDSEDYENANHHAYDVDEAIGMEPDRFPSSAPTFSPPRIQIHIQPPAHTQPPQTTQLRHPIPTPFPGYNNTHTTSSTPTPYPPQPRPTPRQPERDPQPRNSGSGWIWSADYQDYYRVTYDRAGALVYAWLGQGSR